MKNGLMICQSVIFSELYEKILVTDGLACIGFQLVVSLKNNGFDVLNMGEGHYNGLRDKIQSSSWLLKN